MNSLIHGISIVVSVFVVRAIVKYADSFADKKPVVLDSNKKVLKLNKSYLIVGLICIFLPIFISIAGFISGSWNQKDIQYAMIFIFITSLMGVYLALTVNDVVTYDDNTITHQNIFRQKKSVNWNQIIEMNYSPSAKVLFIKDGKSKIHVTPSMTGFVEFTNLVKQKLTPSIYGDSLNRAINYINRFAKQDF